MGFQLNATKTKIFTTCTEFFPRVVDINGGSVDVLSDATHKYLGKIYAGDLTTRGHVGFQHRVQLVWAKFHQYRTVVTNKDVSIKLRLKLFDSGNSNDFVRISNNATDTNRIDSITVDALQTRMMRSIVGWARMEDETGEVPWHACDVEFKQPYNVVLSHAGPHN